MPEPVIVVVLHRRIREMLELLARMPAAKSLGEAGKAMGITSPYRAQKLAEQAAAGGPPSWSRRWTGSWSSRRS